MAQAKKSVVFYEHATCGTCKKARKWLTGRGVSLQEIPIATSPPSKDELTAFIDKSGKPPRKWLNTSGQSYRALVTERGKEAVQALSDREITALLAKDGKLIKRPVTVAGGTVLVGFDEKEYAAAFPK